MAWEGAKTAVFDGAPAGPETGPARGQPAQDAVPPSAEPAPLQVAKADIEPQSGVVLDEANDLLVITQAGTFIGPAVRGWAEAVGVESATLSPKTASWAQEILAAEAEAEPAGLEDPASGSTQTGADDAPLHNVDWIDW